MTTRFDALRRLTSGPGTVAMLLVAIFAVIVVINPGFAEPPSLLSFARQAAPLVLLAIGQYAVIVSGEFDLSVGALVGAQVVLAALLLDGRDSATPGVVALMIAIGLVVGLVNGAITTILKVPSIITTLGMMLVLTGAIRLLTGGAPTGELSESFRVPGRGGVEDVPWLGTVPWSVIIVAVLGAVAVLAMRTSAGRTLMAVGDGPTAARFSGVPVTATRITAFVLSGLFATFAAILIGGYAGVTAKVGDGLEFTSITAVVLGGVVLGGGRGGVGAAILGAFTVEALFTLFNQLSVPSTLRPAAQGVIIVAAVAYAARDRVRRTAPTSAPAPRVDAATT